MTAVLAEQITEPGVYSLTAEEYHADPVAGGSLTSSGARLLLPPNSPARYRYNADHPPESTKTFDFGSAAHRLVLGTGPDVVVVEASDWRTKAAREQRDEAHAEGKVPLLEDDWGRVIDMAQALRRHPVAAALFDHARGLAERALVWRDPATGVMRRALVDFLPWPGTNRLVIAEYKTCRSAAPGGLDRVIADYGYHQQGAWYVDGVRAVGGGGRDTAILFVFQEKEPPYLVSVIQPTDFTLTVGRHLNQKAIEIYAECTRTGKWPGYSDEVEIIALPPWIENLYKELT